MATLGNDSSYIRQCLQAAENCLAAMLVGKAFEPNDLIAGALGLDRLSKLALDAGNPAQVARDLRTLAKNCSAFELPVAQRFAGSLARGVRSIARAVAESDDADREAARIQHDNGKRP